jgi:ElaB/YqjD/DUF883 family membrane-anchored ribosome-binding protein
MDYSEQRTAYREGAHGDARQEAMEKLRETAMQVDERVRHLVREHPFLAIGGAIAVGYLVGRILSKD